MAKQSPSQTVGPFFAYGLVPEPYGRKGIASNVLAANGVEGEHIRIEGRVLDGKGEPVNDALIEIWQANAHGRYRHARDARDGVPLDPGFTGFGRAMTDDKGVFRFETVKPGRVPGGGNAWQAPHIGVTVLARGMPNHAYSRIYFSDEEKANAEDPVLALVPPARRGTLIARREAGAAVYRFDIRLQGEDETVFFDA
ncbi:MAG TPA: protocatechuate 3,4-dioxygenase subunit alpha [Alphaproteobacteria bacterium]|nr:protocatechuate 3,4-dioxygenase subunit alpha [Alphaproteobacteria bacterium]